MMATNNAIGDMHLLYICNVNSLTFCYNNNSVLVHVIIIYVTQLTNVNNNNIQINNTQNSNDDIIHYKMGDLFQSKYSNITNRYLIPVTTNNDNKRKM
jgi:hypothetical protein